MKEELKIGMTIYCKDARGDSFDYYPQVIQEIEEDTVKVFEEGYWPEGKHFTVPIKYIRKEILNGETIIIHS